MADSKTHCVQLHSITARLNLRQQKAAVATVLPLPLVRSLKQALVMAGAEGNIPRSHAQRLITLLKLGGV